MSGPSPTARHPDQHGISGLKHRQSAKIATTSIPEAESELPTRPAAPCEKSSSSEPHTAVTSIAKRAIAISHMEPSDKASKPVARPPLYPTINMRALRPAAVMSEPLASKPSENKHSTQSKQSSKDCVIESQPGTASSEGSLGELSMALMHKGDILLK